MKVACICNDDYANFMYCQVEAMRMAGVDATGYKMQQSVYNYPVQCSISRGSMMRNITADVYMVFHSHMEVLNYINTNRSPVVVVHTGTRFRKNADQITKECVGYRNVIALPEFATHLPDADYVVGCIDDRSIRQVPPVQNRFGHYPSNAEVKGTEVIRRVSIKAGVPIHIDTTRMNYLNHVKRVSSVDIIVEMLKPRQDGGYAYGSFGMQALEASAIGKVVITNNLTGQELYARTYGDCELEIANDEQQLYDKLIQWRNGDTINKGRAVAAWYHAKHGMAATGKRWAGIVRG